MSNFSAGTFATVRLDPVSSNVIRTERIVNDEVLLDDCPFASMIFTQAVQGLHGTPRLLSMTTSYEQFEQCMPYYGKTLWEWTYKHPSKERTAYILDVLSSLAFTCEQMLELGMQHIDLKPNNILVEEVDGALKTTLIDYNICSVQSTRSTDMFHWSSRIGTYAYVAPEVVVGGFPASTSIVWSLGLLIPFMTYKCHPLKVCGCYAKNEERSTWTRVLVQLARKYRGHIPVSDLDTKTIHPSLLELYKASMQWSSRTRLSLSAFRRRVDSHAGKTIPMVIHQQVTFTPRKNIDLRHIDFELIKEVCNRISRPDLLCRCVSLYDLYPWDSVEVTSDVTVVAGIIMIAYMMHGSFIDANKPIYDVISSLCSIDTSEKAIRIVVDVGEAMNWKCYFKPLDVMYYEAKSTVSEETYKRLYTLIKKQTEEYTTTHLYDRFDKSYMALKIE